MHEHTFQGQTLRHEHDGDASPHGYFEHPEDIKAAVPKLGFSGRAGDGTPYATAQDFAEYAAARMNAAGGMDDTEARAENGALVIEVHREPVYRAAFTCTVHGCTVCDSHKFGGYTPDQLKAAWALVPTNEANWKMPIHGFVPEGTDTAVMSAAIAYYCGSPSDFRPQPDGRFEVEAPGYYTCVGS